MSLVSEVNYNTNPSSTRRPRRQRSFSLAEFRALVSAALDPDLDSEDSAALLFSFSSSASPASTPTPTSTSASSSAPSTPTAIRTLERKKSALPLQPTHTQSRVRLLLAKLKKRAAALVRRRRGSHSSSSHKPGVRSVHVQVQTAAEETELLFEPYLPLAAQYERVRGGAGAVYPFLLPSTPNTSLARASFASPAASSEESYYPFSAHTAQSEESHAPPSPTVSTFSSSSLSAGGCSYDVNATNNRGNSTSECGEVRPWSVATYDSGLGLGLSSSFPSSSPFAPTDGLGMDIDAEADPFAKGAVRVVHRSCEALPHPTLLGSGYWLRGTRTYNAGGGGTRRARKGRAKRVRRDSGVGLELAEGGVAAQVEKKEGKQRNVEKEQSSPPSSFPFSSSHLSAPTSATQPGPLSLSRAQAAPSIAAPHTRTLRRTTRTRPGSPFPLS
ncbi:hypothetical protein C8F04DRAFT_1402070 [Mycena alexandri]|uniref:Uncharacterized protein n=1 Tax=Mycena alexandri TaxID=1745969 RepID=A0AAD6S890_9AGAR|nr:hypothetical protein C8F04DRAFT_1402070 [Mycena alexandri]